MSYPKKQKRVGCILLYVLCVVCMLFYPRVIIIIIKKYILFIILVKIVSIFVGHNRFREAVRAVDTTG
jgi:hypothetical protein